MAASTSAPRASGVSLAQTAVPVVVLAGAISVAGLVWNETVVPYCSANAVYALLGAVPFLGSE